MASRVTISDVAREAEVSLMTVSRVINNKEDVSEATRQRVLEVIERLGYRPSAIARGLATQSTGTIGLVIPDIANPFFAEVVRGAEHMAYAEGYNLFLCNTEEDPSRELAVLQSLEEKCVDGVILCSSRLSDDELQVAITRYPAAVLVNRRLNGAAVGVAIVDDENCGRIATQHLIDGGHQAIGLLAGPSTSSSGLMRTKGYRVTLSDAGLPYKEDWIKHCSSGTEGGKDKTRELLTAYPEMTALFCYNDLVAVGALQACTALDRAVPDDVAIVGTDDIFLAALVTPALTTCHIPQYELGAQAMRLLLNRIDDCIEECEEIVLSPKLIIRVSAP